MGSCHPNSQSCGLLQSSAFADVCVSAGSTIQSCNILFDHRVQQVSDFMSYSVTWLRATYEPPQAELLLLPCSRRCLFERESPGVEAPFLAMPPGECVPSSIEIPTNLNIVLEGRTSVRATHPQGCILAPSVYRICRGVGSAFLSWMRR